MSPLAGGRIRSEDMSTSPEDMSIFSNCLLGRRPESKMLGQPHHGMGASPRKHRHTTASLAGGRSRVQDASTFPNCLLGRRPDSTTHARPTSLRQVHTVQKAHKNHEIGKAALRKFERRL